jgi:hypothetical protein
MEDGDYRFWSAGRRQKYQSAPTAIATHVAPEAIHAVRGKVIMASKRPIQSNAAIHNFRETRTFPRVPQSAAPTTIPLNDIHRHRTDAGDHDLDLRPKGEYSFWV